MIQYRCWPIIAGVIVAALLLCGGEYIYASAAAVLFAVLTIWIYYRDKKRNLRIIQKLKSGDFYIIQTALTDKEEKESGDTDGGTVHTYYFYFDTPGFRTFHYEVDANTYEKASVGDIAYLIAFSSQRDDIEYESNKFYLAADWQISVQLKQSCHFVAIVSNPYLENKRKQQELSEEAWRKIQDEIDSMPEQEFSECLKSCHRHQVFTGTAIALLLLTAIQLLGMIFFTACIRPHQAALYMILSLAFAVVGSIVAICILVKSSSKLGIDSIRLRLILTRGKRKKRANRKK